MYGWRLRIGFICPSSTFDTPGYEFYRMAPQGVGIVGTIMGIRHLTDKDIGRALGELERVAREYAKNKVDIVVLGGSPPVIWGGADTEKLLIETMENASLTKATTSQTGAVEALRALNISKVGVTSPFDDHQNSKLKEYLMVKGFEVPVIRGLDVALEDIALLPNEASYRAGRELSEEGKGKIDGMYLPCAQWPTIENIAHLERDTQIPVVTSLQAMLWYCMRQVGINEKIEGYGKLFSI